MGGWGNAIANLAKTGIEAVGSKIGKSPAAHELAEKVESGLYHAVFKPEAAFKDIPAGQELWKAYTGPYQQLKNKYESEATQVASGKIAPAGKHTNITPGMDSSTVHSHAKKLASQEVFGENREVIQGVLKHVENTVSKNRADIMSDHLNILFKEQPIQAGMNKGKSSFDVDMMRGKEGFDGPHTKYKGTNSFEQAARWHQKMLAYKAAIPHLASNLNILWSDGLTNYGKTLMKTFGPGAKANEASLLAHNAISELYSTAYRQKEAFDKGLIKQFAPGSVGEFVHKNMYIPGMNQVRYMTLVMSAHASELAAKEAVENLKSNDLRRALPIFNELRLDPNKIKSQGYQLLKDDMDKVYYHGTNTRAFLEQNDSRNIMMQRSPLFRVAGAFHSYVSNQSQFFAKTLKRMYAQGDFVGIARNLATAGMVFPLVGASIYESERLLAGNDWDDPAKHFGNRLEATPAGMAFDAVTGRYNAKTAAATTMNTLESIAHIGAWGAFTGYYRGAERRRLANQMLGPDANMLVQGVEDAVAAKNTDVNHPDAWKPFARDVMSDLPLYGVGSISSHETLPTRKEQQEGKLKRHSSSRRHKESSNPFNDNTEF
jgi:hypothetical protein